MRVASSNGVKTRLSSKLFFDVSCTTFRIPLSSKSWTTEFWFSKTAMSFVVEATDIKRYSQAFGNSSGRCIFSLSAASASA